MDSLDHSRNFGTFRECLRLVLAIETTAYFWLRVLKFIRIYLCKAIFARNDLSCQKLDRLKLAIDQKWPELANRRGVVFHQDKARPYTSVVTRQKSGSLVWKELLRIVGIGRSELRRQPRPVTGCYAYKEEVWNLRPRRKYIKANEH
ncbi:UNVERIFIED_CONTAM: hypothetical protein NCL1_22521 [Trichonephila clavipes]